MDESLKKRREISYRINIWDDINLPSQINFKDISNQVITFFKTTSALIYPAKSYFVAIVYAACMQKYFNIDFYKALDDSELLVDDKYFIPYSKSLEIYDKILENIGDIFQYQSIAKTVDYFKKEFLIDCKNKLWNL